MHLSFGSSPGIGKLWPSGQIWPAASFSKLSFTGTQPCPLAYVSSMAAFVLHGQNGVVTEN